MKLAKLREFRSLNYTEASAPSENTLRRQIERKEIPGGTRRGRTYYVDLDEYDRATNLRRRLAAEQAELAKHPLLAGLV